MAVTGRIFNIQKFSINDGPGIRTTVFFKGCPLRCGWCANPESQDANAAAAQRAGNAAYTGRESAVDEVMAVVRQDIDFYIESGGGMTLSGGEPLLQIDFARALIEAAHAENIHCAVETTGFIDHERFLDFMPLPDLFLYDFKHYDRDAHFEGTGVHNDVIIKNLSALAASGRPVIARIPVIPRFNVGMTCARRMAGTLRDIGIKKVELLPFHQLGEKKYEELNLDYRWKGVRQLHPEMLGNYLKAFTGAGLDCGIR